MVIGIIGAGIAGLTAGKILAQKGHEVIVIEKSRGFGGRLSTRYAGEDLKIKVDHGAPYIQCKGEEFTSFVAEMQGKGILEPWTESFSFFNDDGFFEQHPSREKIMSYMAPNGMNKIGQDLSRWVDFRSGKQVGGITTVSDGSRRKRPWILNMTDISVLEVDALIMAVPAVQASGLLQTSQDETPVRALHVKTSTIGYDSIYTLMTSFGDRQVPDFKGIACDHDVLSFISNESSKRDNGELTFVAQANAGFSHRHRDSPKDIVEQLMTKAMSEVLGSWAETPYWSQVHFWRYGRAQNFIDAPFLESTNNEAPLALIGDYFQGNSVESAYVSGKRLAEHWLTKLPI